MTLLPLGQSNTGYHMRKIIMGKYSLEYERNCIQSFVMVTDNAYLVSYDLWNMRIRHSFVCTIDFCIQ